MFNQDTVTVTGHSLSPKEAIKLEKNTQTILECKTTKDYHP